MFNLRFGYGMGKSISLNWATALRCSRKQHD